MFHTTTEPSQLAEAWHREQLLILACFLMNINLKTFDSWENQYKSQSSVVTI